MQELLKIENVFTLEASFYGYDDKTQVVPFEVSDLKKLGEDIGWTVYSLATEEKSNSGLVFEALEELRNNKKLIEVGDQSSVGSNDQDSIDEFFEKEELTQLKKISLAKETTIASSENPVLQKKNFVVQKKKLQKEKLMNFKKQAF